jgi:hypothetical protein
MSHGTNEMVSYRNLYSFGSAQAVIRLWTVTYVIIFILMCHCSIELYVSFCSLYFTDGLVY